MPPKTTDIQLHLQRLSDAQVAMQKDYYEHQRSDEKAFDRIDEKFTRLETKLDRYFEEQTYVMVALKVIGAIAVIAWATVKVWFERR